ncbi:histidine kinase/DNA gyrase B/HSP90-like ATPase [Yoonia maritima]|uniref:Histidine kinase/DNA gyrase B/HSP90-like ATPase n=1 Tax=Yoonia maritima TaxID=1435347 RepID=A0A2T0VUY5_9RHOB|nr:ATP-binding protein [Yoonia maritima]PRY75308.1 histidine kinase/DNA gyrase B/HSP90-like ATPase [Yoonia maritima]
MTDELINEPDAPRLINGLRDTGYNFRTAASDIIDNCIAAGASEINVQIEMDTEGRKYVYFGDNGTGMDAAGVFHAMRYGAPERENPESLGKFGLGLKTASSSVCRQFTLISRTSEGEDLNKLTWDLDHVEKIGLWEMRRDPVTTDESETFEELCGSGSGTLVIWSKCDRILTKNYDEPGGAKEKSAIRRLADGLRSHVGMIYHRFIDEKDERQRNITLMIDGGVVVPWDPFFKERSDQVLSETAQIMEIEVEDRKVHNAKVAAWILPHSDDLTSAEKERAKISNRGQGFYIYREGRLISDGGWLSVFGGLDPHMSLLRIEFDFGHELDEAFSIDVKKSRILLDPALAEYLVSLLTPPRREANLRYRKKTQKTAAAANVDHTSANKTVENTTNTRKAGVEDADAASQTAVVSNNRGSKITIKQRVESNVEAEGLYINPVDNITTGDLWEPSYRSAGDVGHVGAVLLNKHHDFYQKIYLRAAGSGYSVQGMDLLLWAFSMAEQNNVNEELEPIFADIREEVSSNLRKLLREVPTPTLEDFDEEGIGEE